MRNFKYALWNGVASDLKKMTESPQTAASRSHPHIPTDSLMFWCPAPRSRCFVLQLCLLRCPPDPEDGPRVPR